MVDAFGGHLVKLRDKSRVITTGRVIGSEVHARPIVEAGEIMEASAIVQTKVVGIYEVICVNSPILIWGFGLRRSSCTGWGKNKSKSKQNSKAKGSHFACAAILKNVVVCQYQRATEPALWGSPGCILIIVDFCNRNYNDVRFRIHINDYDKRCGIVAIVPLVS